MKRLLLFVVSVWAVYFFCMRQDRAVPPVVFEAASTATRLAVSPLAPPMPAPVPATPPAAVSEAGTALDAPVPVVASLELLRPFLAPDILADMDETVLPTAEGLFLRTVDWWGAQEGLLELTGDELAAMLPDEREYALGGGITLAEMVNGLPTREDCERAYADPEVQRLLLETCKLEVPLIELGCELFEDRAPEPAKLREELRALASQQLDATQRQLMRELERASGYAHWAFLGRVVSAWMAGEPQIPEMENSR